jgi:hypothetical protein
VDGRDKPGHDCGGLSRASYDESHPSLPIRSWRRFCRLRATNASGAVMIVHFLVWSLLIAATQSGLRYYAKLRCSLRRHPHDVRLSFKEPHDLRFFDRIAI